MPRRPHRAALLAVSAFCSVALLAPSAGAAPTRQSVGMAHWQSPVAAFKLPALKPGSLRRAYVVVGSHRRQLRLSRVRRALRRRVLRIRVFNRVLRRYRGRRRSRRLRSRLRLVLVSGPRHAGGDAEAAVERAVLVSSAADRSSAVPLSGATEGGAVYPFVPKDGVKRVLYYVDDPNRTQPPYSQDKLAPFDLAKTAADGTANPFDTRKLSNGAHTVTAAAELTRGGTAVLNAGFTVDNSSTTGGVPTQTPPPPACSDGQDNDGDGKVDYPLDPGCDSALDADEADPAVSPVPGPVVSDPLGPGGSWKLVFGDDFSASSLDLTAWHTCFWWSTVTCSIESNNELELYNPADVYTEGGVLRMRAQRRDLLAWNGKTYNYTSGMAMTGGRKYEKSAGFTYTYGHAEARLKVPKGKGLWPAFWMLPVSYNSRPEIDAMEMLGDSTNVQHMNFHYRNADGTKGDAGKTWAGPDFSAGWHTFGLDWEPDALVWYVDGVERWRFTDASVIPKEPMYLLLNLAVGGNWPGAPDASTAFPSFFDVDYVRVWQH